MGKVKAASTKATRYAESQLKKYFFTCNDGTDGRNNKVRTWAKIPKLDYTDRITIGRKLLSDTFVFVSNNAYKKGRYINWRKPWYCKKNPLIKPKAWYRRLKRLKKAPQTAWTGGILTQPRRTRRTTEDIIQRFKAYGINVAPRFINTYNRIGFLGKKITQSYVIEEKEDEGEGQIGVESTEADESRLAGEDASQEEEFDIQNTEEWQRSNWFEALQKEYFSPELSVVAANARLYGPVLKLGIPQMRLVFVLLETMRSGVFTQNWRLVAKSLEGMCEENRFGQTDQRYWIFWNAGFLSLMRFVKDREECKLKVKDFAKDFRKMNVMGCYPRRLALEIALWLTQQGFFNDAIMYIDELETELAKRDPYIKSHRFRQSFNPKRDIINLMVDLIKAVFLYSLWKRDMNSAEEGTFTGDLEDLKRSGESTLSAFEGLLELTQECEADVTTFLDPLIELTLEYRSVIRARDIFKELLLKNYGNAFVEQAFLKFLHEHFPQDEEEIAERLKLKDKFVFKKPSHWINEYRALTNYRAKKSKEVPERLYFKKTPNPSFSW